MLDAVGKRSPLQCPRMNYRVLSGQDEIILYHMSDLTKLSGAEIVDPCRVVWCDGYWIMNWEERGNKWSGSQLKQALTAVWCGASGGPLRMSSVLPQTDISRIQPSQKRERLNQLDTVQNSLHLRFIQVTLEQVVLHHHAVGYFDPRPLAHSCRTNRIGSMYICTVWLMSASVCWNC
jgi:hypothetical protein